MLLPVERMVIYQISREGSKQPLSPKTTMTEVVHFPQQQIDDIAKRYEDGEMTYAQLEAELTDLGLDYLDFQTILNDITKQLQES